MFDLPELSKVRQRESGQALLLVLLAMAAILTIVLSVASRSVTDISVTSSEENALRAFSAAEAGVEKTLLTGQTSGGYPVSVDTSDPTVTYASKILTSNEGTSFEYPSLLNSGETATIWMVSHNPDGTLTCSGGNPCYSGGPGKPVRICWGDGPTEAASVSDRPAISVDVYFDTTLNSINGSNDYSNVQVARFAYDRYASSRTPGNNFTSSGIGLNAAGCNINGKQYLYQSPNVTQTVCSTAGCVLMVKVRMFYNPTLQPLATTVVGGGNVFPAQGKMIVSTGVAGESTRKVNVFQSFSEAPNLFDSAVFSMGDFSK